MNSRQSDCKRKRKAAERPQRETCRTHRFNHVGERHTGNGLKEQAGDFEVPIGLRWMNQPRCAIDVAILLLVQLSIVVVVVVVVVVDAVDVAVAVIVFTTVDPIVSAAVVDTVIDIHDVDSLLLL